MKTTDEMQLFIGNSQSTHAPGVSASAARLIILLRKRYPIQYENSKKLEQFLGLIKDPSDAQLINTCIDKLKGTATDQWANNTYYDHQSRQLVTVTASFVEILGLVCSASLDRTTLPPEIQDPKLQSTSIQQRIETLCNCFKQLLIADKICTGGKQHALLFLLNGYYFGEQGLDRKPIATILVEDINAYIFDQISRFIGWSINKEFEGKDGSSKYTFILNWIIGKSPDAWLDGKKPALIQFLNEQCQKMGIDPTSSDVKKYITASMENIHIWQFLIFAHKFRILNAFFRSSQEL